MLSVDDDICGGAINSIFNQVFQTAPANGCRSLVVFCTTANHKSAAQMIATTPTVAIQQPHLKTQLLNRMKLFNFIVHFCMWFWWMNSSVYVSFSLLKWRGRLNVANIEPWSYIQVVVPFDGEWTWEMWAFGWQYHSKTDRVIIYPKNRHGKWINTIIISCPSKKYRQTLRVLRVVSLIKFDRFKNY